MKSPLDIIRATYEGPSEENGKNLLLALAPNATWTEAAGFPYAGTYTGAEDIIANVFQRLAAEWIDYRAQVHTYLADGDRVAAFGVYSGTYRETGKAMTATFAHLYLIKDGKIASMEQYVDSAMVREALTD
jgi:ketosteroid isomerase-like protein